MKLSEAIREGAKKRPQTRGRYFNEIGGKVRSCAIGAGYEGIKGRLPSPHIRLHLVTENIERAMPDVGLFKNIRHPVSRYFAPLHDVVAALNDGDGWTREQIADWLESEGL